MEHLRKMKTEIYSIGNIKDDLSSISRLFNSNDTLGGINSRHIKFLESKFNKITQRNCVYMSSCTNGIYLALKKLNLNNNFVVVTPITFFGVISAIIKSGGIPLYTRVNEYGLMDTSSIQELKENYNIAAVVPSHINNRYVDLSNVINSTIIEDAAPAYGIKRKDGSSILDTPNTTVISFSYGKPLSSGEGGMIILNNNDCDKWYLEQRFCGLSTNGIYGYDTFDVIQPELKLTNNALSAALVTVKLKSFEEQRQRSKIIANYYNITFGHLLDSELYEYGNHQTFVLLSNKRDNIMDALDNIDVKSYKSHRPVYYNEAFKNYNGSENYISTCESYWNKILHIPCRYDLSDAQVSLIAETVKKSL